MPYKTDLQRRFFHSPGAKKAGITEQEVKEYDEASKGMKLPKVAAPSTFEHPKRFSNLMSKLKKGF